MPARVRSFRGWPAVTLTGGDYEATFLPELGMLGVSLRWRGRELLSLHGGLDGWRRGHTTGMPLLAPWANRLAGSTYRVGRTKVDLRGARHLHRDGNGLPIHGTLLGEHGWEVLSLRDDADRGRVETAFALTSPSLLRSFPFPHHLRVDVEVARRGMTVQTVLTPAGRRPVPVSFGWHPYFRLPGSSRAAWRLTLPSRRRLVLDPRQIPTGQTVEERHERIALRGVAFDDGFALGRDRRFVLDDGSTKLAVTMDDGYPFAQIYAPTGRRFVAMEPMTAPTNALVTGHHPTVARGEEYEAGFAVRVSPARAVSG